MIELPDQAGEVPDAVIIGVKERFDVKLVDDSVLVPEPVGAIDHGRCKRNAGGALIGSGTIEGESLASGQTLGPNRRRNRPVSRTATMKLAHYLRGVPALVSGPRCCVLPVLARRTFNKIRVWRSDFRLCKIAC